jgi:hypothetical protein
MLMRYVVILECHDFMILILSLYNLTDPSNYSSKEKKRPIE